MTRYSFGMGPKAPPEFQRNVVAYDAHSYGDRQSFKILSSDKVVNVFCVENEYDQVEEGHGAHLYLPVHPDCLELAERFIDLQKSWNCFTVDGSRCRSVITSHMDLWEILYRRLSSDADNPCHTWELPEPHD